MVELTNINPGRRLHFPSLLHCPQCMYHPLDQAYNIQRGVAPSKASNMRTLSHEAVPYMSHSVAKCPHRRHERENGEPIQLSLLDIVCCDQSDSCGHCSPRAKRARRQVRNLRRREIVDLLGLERPIREYVRHVLRVATKHVWHWG